MSEPLHTSPLAAIVDDLTRRGADMQLSIGLAGDEWRPWSALTEDPMARRDALRKEAEFNGLDARGQAAYLIGGLAYGVTTLLVALRSAGVDVAAVTAQSLHYRHDVVHWEEDGQSGSYNRMLFGLADGIAVGVPAGDIESVRRQIVGLLQPALLAISADTGLGKAALWRQAADNVASGFLYTGRSLGFEAEAMAEGLALLRTTGSPLTNKQTGFVTISVTDTASGRSLSDTFRARGGCCRAYTTGDGGYCSTCVLIPLEERDARLSDYLLGQLTGTPA